MIRLRDITAPFPGGQGVHIAADGARGSADDSEAVIKHPLVKKTGDSGLSLEIDKHHRKMFKKCYQLMIMSTF